MSGLRLNLGCGMNRLDGYVNVDRHGELGRAAMTWRLSPWPWPDDSGLRDPDEACLGAFLGRDPNVLPRDHQGNVPRLSGWARRSKVIVPHHRHEFFFNDPTHVRAVTAEGMMLFFAAAQPQLGQHSGLLPLAAGHLPGG